MKQNLNDTLTINLILLFVLKSDTMIDEIARQVF